MSPGPGILLLNLHDPVHTAEPVATPARIAGCADRLGNLAPRKQADLVVLERDLTVTSVYIAGELVT